MELKSVEGILFVQYLTGYNIQEVYHALQFENVSKFVEDYCKSKNAEWPTITTKLLNERHQDAIIAKDKLVYYGIEAIPYYSEFFPDSLRKIKNCPPMIFVKGNFQKDKKYSAIVGSRKVSSHAKNTVETIAQFLISKDYGIVSGLALGIDTLAHIATIKNKGYTIAVLPNSLDSVYPKENYRLANKILESGGALISEMPFGINRGKKSFVERNRIQSGLSDIVMPVEMGVASGTMHTVSFCINQGKKLMVPVPSNDILNTSEYEGIRHLLIKQQQTPSPYVSFFKNLESLETLLGGGNHQGILF